MLGRGFFYAPARLLTEDITEALQRGPVSIFRDLGIARGG